MAQGKPVPGIFRSSRTQMLDAAAHLDLALFHTEGKTGAGLQAGPGKPCQLRCCFKAEFADVAFDFLSGATIARIQLLLELGKIEGVPVID